MEESHAVVMVEAGEETPTVYDPLHGERRLSRQRFTTAWAARHNLVLLVERRTSRPKRPTPRRLDYAH